VLVDASGGGGSDLLVAGVLAVAWLALYGTHRAMMAAVAGYAAALSLPAILVGAPRYPVEYLHVVLVCTAVAGVVGVSIQHLVQATERQSAAALSREELYEALVRDFDEVVSVVDRDGRVRYLSPAIKQLSGFRPTELVNTDYTDLICPEDVANARQLLSRAAADPGVRHRAELRIRRQTHATPIRRAGYFGSQIRP
jgi:PAS domain S-box-containing protein